MKLIGFDFEIKYRPGKLNTVADVLSRKDHAQLFAFTCPVFGIFDDIRIASQHDTTIATMLLDISNGKPIAPGYSVRQGLLLFNGRVVVPQESALRARLLREFHSSS
ncbi:hypothetical protein HRI_003894700 [Hibiscus trionum]|uniref:Uncharacterized protein n=1 Tax=Hibiscus trionum TaxID=183268 RepID=A0A9W7ITB4_HIBTR|nr:hypothetical protein HRI_003894700 [Hibiscus trionum]